MWSIANYLNFFQEPIYWLTSGMHSTENGGPEMLQELAYRLAVQETDFVRAIRETVITFITPEVRPLGGDDTALLVRGEDRFGHFGLEPRPKADMDKSALAAHELAMAKRNPILYRNAALPPAPNHADKHPGVAA